MSYQLIRGDATSIPLADDSVDLIVTSPPYFALRSYTDGGEHYDGQIGSEATPQAFLEALWAVTAECRRVLKPSGSLFCNLGDKYAAGHGGSSTENGGVTIRKRASFAAAPKTRDDLPNPPGSWGEREATGRNGTGTVPAVAHALGRHGIGIDLSADYLRLADWRCNDPALRAKVLGVDKPKPVIEGQTSLFDEVA